MPLQNHNEWELRTRLNKEEILNPDLVINQLFDFAPLPQLRILLWTLLKSSITGSYRELPSKEQYNLLSFYEKLEKLLEATHLVYEAKAQAGKVSSSSFLNDAISQVIGLKGGDVLLQIVQRVITITGAEKIFLIPIDQDSAPASQKNYSLLVLLSDRDEYVSRQYQDLIQAACIDLAQVTALFISSNELNQWLKQGHIFYSVRCTPENLLYNAGEPLPLKTSLPVQQVVNNAREEFMLHFSRADAFLDGARHYYMQNENELSTFLLHQAVEHSYRSLLITLTGYEDISHDLYRLRRISLPLSEALQPVFSISDEKENNLLSLLQDAYQDARYTKDFKVADGDAALLLNQVEQLLQLTQIVFEEKVKAFEAHFSGREV